MKSKILTALLLVVPISAYANAGTPLMWAGIMHLLFGNLIIGIIEGVILWKAFKLPYGRCFIFLILANYISAWLGGVLINNVIRNLLDVHLDLYNTWFYFWSMVLVTFLLTLIIEWPFVAICFRGTEKWLKRSMKANLLVQSTTYILIFGWYWLASGTSLYTHMKITGPDNIPTSNDIIVIYISSDDGDVYTCNLKGKEKKKIFVLKSSDRNDRLIVRENKGNSKTVELVAYTETENRRSPKLVDLKTFDGFIAQPDWRTESDPQKYEGTWFNFGPATRLGSASDSNLKFYSGFWAVEGLWWEDSLTNKSHRFSFETPFAAWYVRNVTHLPGDLVVFQLGEHQICILEAKSNQIALLVHGRGPVVLMKDTSSGKENTDNYEKLNSKTTK